jgi:hypothetical protein
MEIEQVAVAGPTEGIDALRVVPDHHDVASLPCQQPGDLGLEHVRVLVLVHHHVTIALADPGPHLGALFE